jgi:hypothetical protein
MLYETPLYVVPTSNARTSLRDRPSYGCPNPLIRRLIAGKSDGHEDGLNGTLGDHDLELGQGEK